MKMIKTILALIITTVSYSQDVTTVDVSSTFNSQLAYIKDVYISLDTAETVSFNGDVFISFQRDSSVNYKIQIFCDKFRNDSIFINSLDINGVSINPTILFSSLSEEYLNSIKPKKFRKYKKGEAKKIKAFMIDHCEYMVSHKKGSHKQGRLTYRGRCKKHEINFYGTSETLTSGLNPNGRAYNLREFNNLLISYLEYHNKTKHWETLISEENSTISTYVAYDGDMFVLLNFIEF